MSAPSWPGGRGAAPRSWRASSSAPGVGLLPAAMSSWMATTLRARWLMAARSMTTPGTVCMC